MAQEYKIHTLDPGKEPFLDRNGNQWINVLFEGHLSTPTKWVMRPESVSKYKVGDTVYGRLETPEGKNYERFYKEQKPDGYGSNQASSNGFVAKSNYTPNPEQQESIARSVAYKGAIEWGIANKLSESEAFAFADRSLAWLQGGSKESAAVPTPSADSSGPARSPRQDDRDEDAEIRSMMQNMPPDEEQYS